METTAAVMRALHEPLSLETIELDEPRAGEVLIRMVAAGICGSDRHIREGVFPSAVPAVCGHEGAGVVEAVGPGVDTIAVGDHVIHTFVSPCGRCDTCRRGQPTFCPHKTSGDGTMPDGTYRMHDGKGADIATTLGLGSFSHHTVSPITSCVVVPPDIDLAAAALISCGVSTGVGAALNVARVRPGDSVAVIGIGGVGAAALMGATLGGAARIIAVDINDDKAAPAAEFGATDFVNARDIDPTEAIVSLTGGRGADAVLLTVDQIRPEHYGIALESLAPGGIAVQVGASPAIDHLPVPPSIFTRKQVSMTGTVYGGMNPERDALRYSELVRTGRLPVEKLITNTYALSDIDRAFDDLAAGVNIRGVIDFER